MTDNVAPLAVADSCRRCGRALRSTRSLRCGYGQRCYTKINRACAVLVASGNKAAGKAAQLLHDGGIVRLRGHQGRAFIAVSSDGEHRYLCSPDGCNCRAGTRSIPVLCYHRAAATILCER